MVLDFKLLINPVCINQTGMIFLCEKKCRVIFIIIWYYLYGDYYGISWKTKGIKKK